jgi:hypothetical protein
MNGFIPVDQVEKNFSLPFYVSDPALHAIGFTQRTSEDSAKSEASEYGIKSPSERN